jgi:hypothetical protein
MFVGVPRVSRKCGMDSRYGGGVWKSNPPFDPRRTESPALKTGKVTGPLSPPPRFYRACLMQQSGSHPRRQLLRAVKKRV